MTDEMKKQIAEVRAKLIAGKSIAEIRSAGYAEAAIRSAAQDRVAQWHSRMYDAED